MATLANRRVLRDGTHGLEFVNEMVRAAAYVGIPISLRKVLHGKIADRFAAADAGSGEASSLEMAWHCIRAGRTKEATPYLLRGARRAIQFGSPYAAARGLSSALANLHGTEQTEALVLLAEAMQEQSRWLESLGVLDRIHETEPSPSTSLAFVLRTKAQWRLGCFESQELSDLPRKLLMFIESCADRASKLRAAVEAAAIIDASAHHILAPVILERIRSLDRFDLEPDDEAHLLLAESMLLYSSNLLDSSLNRVHEAIDLLESRKMPNSALAMFYQGLGAIKTKQGAYGASVTAYLKCHQTAIRVGNDAIAVQAGANLALSLSRLGEYKESLEWAGRALALSSKENLAHFCLPAVLSTILSLAMLGRDREAETGIREGTERFGSFGSIGRSQAWALHCADVYAMMGNTEQAVGAGLRGTSGVNDDVHMIRYAGPYARWVARTTLHQESARRGEDRLSKLMTGLETFDAIDRVEVLNAKTWLDAKNGNVGRDELQRMRSELRGLPTAVEDQLARIGMLDF